MATSKAAEVPILEDFYSRRSVLSLIKHWVNHWPDILLFDEGYTKTLLQFSKHVKGEKEAENQAIDELQQLVNTQLARNFAKKQVCPVSLSETYI